MSGRDALSSTVSYFVNNIPSIPRGFLSDGNELSTNMEADKALNVSKKWMVRRCRHKTNYCFCLEELKHNSVRSWEHLRLWRYCCIIVEYCIDIMVGHTSDQRKGQPVIGWTLSPATVTTVAMPDGYVVVCCNIILKTREDSWKGWCLDWFYKRNDWKVKDM